jgi:hypothetical protein
VVPVGMPQDTAFSAYFGPLGVAYSLSEAAAPPGVTVLGEAEGAQAGRWRRPTPEVAPTTTSDGGLVGLATMLEPDGEMPGASPGVRRANDLRQYLPLWLRVTRWQRGHSGCTLHVLWDS